MKKLLADLRMFAKIAGHINSLSRGIVLLKAFRAVFVALSPFVNIYMAARIVDLILDGAEMRKILWYAGITVLLSFIIRLISSGLSRVLGPKNAEFINNYEKSKKFKVSELDFVKVENVETQKTISRISEEEHFNAGGIRRFYNNFESLIASIFSMVFSASLFFALFTSPYPKELTGMAKIVSNPYFGLIIIILILFYVFFGVKASVKTSKYFSEQSRSLIFCNQLGAIVDSLPSASGGTAMDIRIYNQGPLLLRIIDENQKLGESAIRKISSYRMRQETLPMSIINFVIEIILYSFAAVGALVGRYSVGSVTQYISSIFQFSGALKNFVSVFAELRFNNQIAKIYFDFIETPSEMVQGSLPVEKRDDREYSVEFRDVSFRYPNTDFWALRHVNLKFQIGQRLAVVGMNGSGKTTFIKLMCRLYDPTEGQILLNGIDIRKYDYAEYRSIFSVVFQDFKLFAFTLGQNVAASMEYDREKAEECLVEANFGERLKTMPHGTDTYLYRNFEKEGVEISGGEAQKIALARALYKDAPFIILDEPTAALDPIAEAEVYSNFNSIVGDKTAIYISHRLSSCRFCDQIAVFHEGSIVQTGTHDELVAEESGKYHELWQAQAQYYTE